MGPSRMNPKQHAQQQDGCVDRQPQVAEALKALELHDMCSSVHILEQYVALLMHWNRRVNLTAIRDEASIWTLHLLDCLAVLPLLRNRLRRRPDSATASEAGPSVTVLDAGTGAGLPAILLALGEPNWRVFAVDAVDKKIVFLRHAAASLGLRGLIPMHARLEQLGLSQKAHPGWPQRGFDIVVSRAFGSLSDFVQNTRHLCGPGGFFCAMKGQTPAAEIEAFQQAFPGWLLETMTLHVPGLDAQRCAVIMHAPCSSNDSTILAKEPT